MKVATRKSRYKAVVLGGTFDVFHRGHEEFLALAFKLGERVLIGISSDRLVRRMGKSHPVQSYSSRVREVRRFLKQNGWSRRGEIHGLSDPFGPGATRRDIQALVVTSNTLGSGRRLNVVRRRRGLHPLEIRKVPLARAEDGVPISSTRIRNGEIDRQGRLLRRTDDALRMV